MRATGHADQPRAADLNEPYEDTVTDVNGYLV